MGPRGRDKVKGLKMSTFLVGEPYRDFDDPQFNSHIQRTWVYGKEKSLKVAENNLNKTLSQFGGKAPQSKIMEAYRKTAFPRFKIGDAANTLPLESNLA